MPYFPNYLSLASPYAFLGLNFFNTMEYQMRLMDRLFGELQRRGATTFEVTEQANADYLDRMTELLGDSLWTLGNCASSRSYYFNPHGEPSLLRPMSTRDAITEHRNSRSATTRSVRTSSARTEFTCREGGRPRPRRNGPVPFRRAAGLRGLHQARVPDDTRTHVYIDGGIETAVGLGIAARKTRKFAVLGLVAYLLYLGGNVVRQK